MDPDYCQNPIPVYVAGGGAAAISLAYLVLSQMKVHKQSPSVYYNGFGLFLIIGLSICARQYFLGKQDLVEEIYRDILKNVKEIDKAEKTHLSALISQAMHGDVSSESLSDKVLGWTKVLTGFSNNQQSKLEAWSDMKGMSKQSALNNLRDRACTIVGQINKIRRS